MTHPKEHPSVSRRDFLRRAAAAGIAVPSMSAILAACRDSTSPSGPATGGTSEPGTIALARPDAPVTLPLYDDIPAIEDGLDIEAGPLRIYNWNDYIDEQTLKRFEAETKIKVVYDVYDANELLDAKLRAGKSGYDLVVPTASPFFRDLRFCTS